MEGSSSSSRPIRHFMRIPHANAGLIVGVLTGTGTADYLFHNGADAIIPHIGYLSRLFGFTTTRDRSSSDITVLVLQVVLVG